MDRKEVERRFLDDTADHQMGIALNDGVFRHITFKRPGSYAYSFNITTWPGHLCISGDMSCFVFSRLRDMFEFFCHSSDWKNINPQYWAEKLQAQSRSGHKEFSQEKYQKILREQFELWDFEDDTQKQEAWENIENELFDQDDIQLAYQYICPLTKQEFVDLWDNNFDDYTFHYLWCCYAIRWGIKKFREKSLIIEEMPDEGMVEALERALMAERERAARTVEDQARFGTHPVFAYIAAAIRKRES